MMMDVTAWNRPLARCRSQERCNDDDGCYCVEPAATALPLTG